MEKIKRESSLIMRRIVSAFKDDDVLWNNEIKANMLVSLANYALIVVLLISYVLAWFGVFEVPMDEMTLVLEINIPLLLGVNIVCTIFNGAKPWIKYMMIIAELLMATALASILNLFVTLIFAIPIVLSVRYFSQNLTKRIAAYTTVLMAVAEIVHGYRGMLNLNLVTVYPGASIVIGNDGLRGAVIESGQYDMGTYISALMRGSFAPRFLLYTIIAIACVEIAKRAHEMVVEQQEISARTEGIKAELDMATNIQKAVLPRIFPAFPERPEIDIYAAMDPAKEVGGDFYDYYMLDDDHLALIMADVSGKGVPAALFMMISKILIKTQLNNTLSVVETAQAVNNQLTEGNESGMFCTAWIGVLEISTGKLRFVDAGHEYAAIKQPGGQFEIIKDNHGFVLAGIEDMEYRENEIVLQPGAKMFLYTDGVTEATDSKEQLYGMDRMLTALNKDDGSDLQHMMQAVREDIDDFVGTAPQFDDLTMLIFEYKGPKERNDD